MMNDLASEKPSPKKKNAQRDKKVINSTLILGLIEAYQLVWHLGLRPRMPKLADIPLIAPLQQSAITYSFAQTFCYHNHLSLLLYHGVIKATFQLIVVLFGNHEFVWL